MLTSLVNHEIKAHHGPDAVVFIGHANRWTNKIPPQLLDPQGSKPKFYCFLYEGWPAITENYIAESAIASRCIGRRGCGIPCFPQATRNVEADATGLITKALGGKIFTIYAPRDLAKALLQISQEL